MVTAYEFIAILEKLLAKNEKCNNMMRDWVTRARENPPNIDKYVESYVAMFLGHRSNRLLDEARNFCLITEKRPSRARFAKPI